MHIRRSRLEPLLGSLDVASLVAHYTIGDGNTKRSISHRPAGPGGVSTLCIAYTGYSPPRQSCRFNRTSFPDSMSERTIGSGIPPHPTPARISWCLVAMSPMRQVLRLRTE